jgi:hypothetical protein
MQRIQEVLGGVPRGPAGPPGPPGPPGLAAPAEARCDRVLGVRGLAVGGAVVSMPPCISNQRFSVQNEHGGIKMTSPPAASAAMMAALRFSPICAPRTQLMHHSMVYGTIYHNYSPKYKFLTEGYPFRQRGTHFGRGEPFSAEGYPFRQRGTLFGRRVPPRRGRSWCALTSESTDDLASALRLLKLYLGHARSSLQAMRRRIERERCWVGPKDASWPMHPCGNTGAKG